MTQLPAHLQRFQARDIGTTLSHNLGTAAPPYVSIAGNRFMLIDAAGNEQPVPTFDPAIGVYLDACIIDANEHISRIYYAQKYDPSAATFNDVPLTHPLNKFVEALYAAGITAGCSNGNFCPDAPVTRGQMAVFLSAALGLHWAP